MLELVTDTRIDLARSGARFAEGCFETLRIQDGAPRWLDLHRERLAGGCSRLGLDAPPESSAIQAAVRPLCANHARGALRLLAVDGRLMAWAEELGAEEGSPVRIGLSRAVRRWSGSPWTSVKTLAQQDNRELGREAKARGLFELVAENEAGRLTDSGRFTLVVAREGRLLTPRIADGALPGIGRRVLMEAGLLAEAALDAGDLLRAEAAALVNALRGLRPVMEAEGFRTFDPDHPLLEAAKAVLA